ncbi:MAG: transposase [Bacteroidota bacterium]
MKPILTFIKSLCFCNPRRISENLLLASSHNTYVETISSSADTIHANLDDWSIAALQQEYARLCVQEIRKLHLGSCEVIFDCTDEDFYGKTQDFWIIPWTKEAGVEGHFRFLVCSIKVRNRKYPVAVRMIRLGTDMANEIGIVLSSCKNAGLHIRTILFDRGFYSTDIIHELQEQDVNYIIFARKSNTFNSMLASTEKSEIIEHEMTTRKHKTTMRVQTNIALAKNVNKYDWVFATNLAITGAEIVKAYRVRWNIETDFRVQDEARIKTKSTRPNVRLFYFIIPLLIFFVWTATQKFKVSFKKFLINLSKTEIVKRTIFFE